ncbi:MAG TPA: MFS transporter, partial [Candidatus Lustribacter sp.]|nr:MFS transporter [Candidatus Lustribacter sp.]
AHVSLLGVGISPGALVPFTLTASTIISAVVLILVGAVADRSPRPTRLFAAFAWTGSLAASLLFLVSGTSWALGIVLLIIANLCLGASLVIYDSLLCRIASPDERDRVSSRGWALGYAGGGLLLALNFGLLSFADSLGISDGTAVRISMLSAGIWWAAFTLIPVLGLRDVQGTTATPVEVRRGVVGGSFTQLATTFKELRAYPQTLLFLLAYLFYNDGIQTVIGSSSLYGTSELGFTQDKVLMVFLLVQFVAFGGALLFGRLAGRYGAWRTVLGGIAMWLVTVVVAFVTPGRQLGLFAMLGVLIGIVMGGTQALSRSLFSQLIPQGREAEFFSLYQAMERGTSWLGTLVFGIVYQLTLSYRSAIIALIVFFVVGGLLLSRLKMREGIIAAGNEVPSVI